MMLALLTVGLLVLGPPPQAAAPEGPTPAPAESSISAEQAEKQKANSDMVTLGGVFMGIGVIPLIAGSVWYSTSVANQREGSDHEPGAAYGPIVIGVGVVGIIAGAVLLGVGKHRQKQAKTARLVIEPVLTWRGDGAQLGVVGRF